MLFELTEDRKRSFHHKDALLIRTAITSNTKATSLTCFFCPTASPLLTSTLKLRPRSLSVTQHAPFAQKPGGGNNCHADFAKKTSNALNKLPTFRRKHENKDTEKSEEFAELQKCCKFLQHTAQKEYPMHLALIKNKGDILKYRTILSN